MGFTSCDSTIGRDVLLQELHEGHPGVVQMKAFARGLLWWPKLDNDREQYVKHCDPCQHTRSMPSLDPQIHGSVQNRLGHVFMLTMLDQ